MQKANITLNRCAVYFPDHSNIFHMQTYFEQMVGLGTTTIVSSCKHAIAKILHTLEAEAGTARVAAWQKRTKRSLKTDLKHACRWAKQGVQSAGPNHFIKQDGTVTISPAEMLDELRKEWVPIFTCWMEMN